MHFSQFLPKKGPSQIAAELAVSAMLKSATSNKGEELKQFVFQGKKYRPLVAKIHIPGIGERTALELCVDKNAQEYLVKEGCIGSVIEEIK